MTSATKRLSLLSVLLLLGAALGWLVMPATLVDLFGIPLEGEAFPAYATLKGMEDLLPALLVVLFVIQENRQALRAALVISVLVPIVDTGLVFNANGLKLDLLMQLPYAILPLAAAYLLTDANRASSAEGHGLPTTPGGSLGRDR